MNKKKNESEVTVTGQIPCSVGCAELLEVGQCHIEHDLAVFLTAAFS